MTTGKFLGIENGEMKIEYTVFDVHEDRFVKRTFTYPTGGDSHRDTFFRGFGPYPSVDGTIGFRPNLPAVGQMVEFDSPSPDMAGHLIVDVCPKVA